MNWKARAKHAIPPAILNRVLLALPFLYRTRFINYESNLAANGGLDDLLAQLALVLDLEGSVIECGSSRCGTSIILANFLRSRGAERRIYACDSFAGFDPAELRQEREAGLTRAQPTDFTSTSCEYVRAKIARLGVADLVVPVKGFFKDTLPGLGDSFCLALIDCDLGESMRYCAETLWPRLARGGRMLFDDYGSADFKGARQAVDGFVEAHRGTVAEHGLLRRLYHVVRK
jgi:O-methyltransferase